MKQRTKEWFDARKGLITGSNVGAILGVDPYRKPSDVMRAMVREWQGLERDFQGNVATDWGTNCERLATKDLEMFHLESPVEEVGFFISEEYAWLGASPDGFVGENSLVEIKCPYGLRKSEKPSFKPLSDLPHYYAQIQIELLCAKKKVCYFYQWAPNGDKLETVLVDKKWLKINIPKLKAFYFDYLQERDNV